MKIDLKHFKKLHSNEDTTTFVHKSGHRITVAHKALDEKTRKQISELPKFSQGGYLESADEYKNAKKAKESKASQKTAEQQKQDDKNFVPQLSNSAHHIPYGYYGGGSVKKDPPPPPAPIDKDKAKEVQDSFKKALGFSDGTGDVQQDMGNAWRNFTGTSPNPDPNAPPEVAPNLQGALGVFQNYKNTMPQQNVLQQGSAPAAEEPNSEQLTQSNLGTDAPEQVSNNAPQASSIDQDVKNLSSGMNMEAKALGNEGNEMARASATHANELDLINDKYKEAQTGLNGERAAALQDLRNGHIEPNHYVQNMSGFQKGMTAIGLVLSGMGGAMAGQHSMAQQFLDKQIDRDIEAQKAELGKKDNLLSHLQQDMGNLKDATIMAKVMQTDMYNAKMMQIAEASKDPLAKARAMQNVAMSQIKLKPMMEEMTLRRGIMQGMKEGKVSPAMAVRTVIPEHHQSEAFKEIEKVEVLDKALAGVTNAMQEVQKLQSAGSRALSPLQSKSMIDALNLQVSSIGKEMFNRLNEQELKMIDNVKIGYTDNAPVALGKIKLVQDILNKNRSTPILDAYGIKMPTKLPGPNKR